MEPLITVVVHPIDTKVHPTYPTGFRWAVMVGGRALVDLDFCVNAGHGSGLQDALIVGEMNGASATKALRLLGVPARYNVLQLDYDPMPAEVDSRPIAEWKE